MKIKKPSISLSDYHLKALDKMQKDLHLQDRSETVRWLITAYAEGNLLDEKEVFARTESTEKRFKGLEVLLEDLKILIQSVQMETAPALMLLEQLMRKDDEPQQRLKSAG